MEKSRSNQSSESSAGVCSNRWLWLSTGENGKLGSSTKTKGRCRWLVPFEPCEAASVSTLDYRATLVFTLP